MHMKSSLNWSLIWYWIFNWGLCEYILQSLSFFLRRFKMYERHVWNKLLSFQTHIKHLQSKIKSRIGFLFCNKASFTHAVKHTLVKLTDPTDPRLWRCHLQNSLQHSTQQIGCSLSQCHPFCHQSPILYPPLRPVCSHYISVAKPIGSRSSISLC